MSIKLYERQAMMYRTLSHLIVLLVLTLSSTLFGSACRPNHSVPPPNDNRGAEKPQDKKDGNGPKGPISGVTPDPDLSPADAMIVSVEKDVSLKRKDAESFFPIFSNNNVAFKMGDTLQIGQASLADIYCENRGGICQLKTGTYLECCTGLCQLTVQMIQRSGLPLKKSELEPAQASALNEAEGKIRALQLGQVTTQFLVTNLYSGWKLEETNQELNRLSEQLAKPEAKQELKDLYAPVMRKTGDINLKFNRVADAKKLYQQNIISTSEAKDPKEKAAAHVALAEAYKQEGDKTKAVENFQIAKEIYVKHGETKSAQAADKKINSTRAILLDRTTLPKTRVMSQKSPDK